MSPGPRRNWPGEPAKVDRCRRENPVQIAAGLAVGKIVLHSFLLFLILRARMEPLLRLRAEVSSLSKAYGALNQRAEIRT